MKIIFPLSLCLGISLSLLFPFKSHAQDPSTHYQSFGKNITEYSKKYHEYSQRRDNITQSVTEIRNNYYGAGIPLQEFNFLAAPTQAGRQRQEYWCWAACIQMVLNYHGLDIQQEDVVEKTFGSLVDRPGTPQQMMDALSGWAPRHNGGRSTIRSEYGIRSETELINHLASKWPLIVGLQQSRNNIAHAYVLTAIYYRLEGYVPVIDKVLLRDPYPNKPSELKMTWNEFLSREPMYFKIWVQ